MDREERPDIDHLYMSALHALGEQGGWPLTMFLTPDGAPFWGGTYFPPEPRWGRPSFQQVLQGVAAAYRDARPGGDAEQRGTAQTTWNAQRRHSPATCRAPRIWTRWPSAYLRMNDPEQGGLKGAPKFPNPPIFRFLWQNAFRTGQPDGQDALHLMLQRMSQGGIYDHLGGGYARYATDAIWLVPHFEKMLYDNAQLLELLALAQAHRPDPLYAQRAAETVGWMNARHDRGQRWTARPPSPHRKMPTAKARKASSTSGPKPRSTRCSAPTPRRFKHAYDVTAGGNWEGHTILRRVTPPGSPAQEAALARAREVLLQARSRRIRPGRDDKVLADWNGLAIAGLARAACVFDQPDWLTRAAAAFDFIMANLGAPDCRVNHAWRLGRVTAAGLLDDQAAMARAAVALYEATGNAERLEQAKRLVAATETWFPDGSGGFYTTASDAADVPLARPRTAGDNATPAGNGVMAEVYARLFHLTGDAGWRTAPRRCCAHSAAAPDQLAGMPGMLAAADLLEEAATVVVAGDPAQRRAQALLAAALGAPDPAVVVLRAPRHGGAATGHPAFGKPPAADGAAAYVCRRSVCGLPVTDPDTLRARLASRG